MMDPYNLAICFGPTLVPVPEDKDQVQYQNQVNELIKNIITFCEEIFPDDIGGIQYEKYISGEPDDVLVKFYNSLRISNKIKIENQLVLKFFNYHRSPFTGRLAIHRLIKSRRTWIRRFIHPKTVSIF